MAVQRSDSPLRPQLSQAEYQRLNQANAEERVRRGMIGYTRKQHAEYMAGQTAGESQIASGVRGTQVTYRGGK
jgi:hypothetical protein